MKRFSLAVIALFSTSLLTMPTTAMSQAPKIDSNTVMSPTNAAEMRNAAGAIGTLFGVGEARSTTDTSHKTMGDVANRALDMVSQATATIASSVEKAAPHVWQIMIRQQYANAFGSIGLPLGLLILIGIYVKITRATWKVRERRVEETSSDHLSALQARDVITHWIPGVVATITGICFVYSAVGAIQILINPEYYAIRDLLQMILGSSTGAR